MFGAFGFEEFQSCRGRREELAHLRGGASVERRRPDRRFNAAIDDDLVSGVGLALARLDGQPSDGADGGECLAAETQRGDIEEVLVAELGGGVSLHGEGQVGRTHALAIVADANEGKPTGDSHHLDLPRAGVERVLHEFLHDAGGPFDHLAGGNAVDRLGAQLADGQWRLPRPSQGNDNLVNPPQACPPS